MVRLLVNRVAANREDGMTGIEWTPQAAPFFRSLSSWRAVWAGGPRSRHSVAEADALAWYVA